MLSLFQSLFRAPESVAPESIEKEERKSSISDKIREIQNPDITSNELIDILSCDEELKTCFSKLAGVREGYTVLEHTKRVLELAQRYRESFSPQVEKLVDWWEFTLFLALHDIGKGISKEIHPNPNPKQLELQMSREILEKTMQKLDLSPEKISIFSAMLKYDSLGDYLQCDIDIDVIKSHIIEMAEMSKTNPKQFYQIYHSFHIIDAASYPTLQDFFKYEGSDLKYCEVYQDMADVLYNKL